MAAASIVTIVGAGVMAPGIAFVSALAGFDTRLVAAGRHGRKSGEGVYRYDAEGRRVDVRSDLGR